MDKIESPLSPYEGSHRPNKRERERERERESKANGNGWDDFLFSVFSSLLSFFKFLFYFILFYFNYNSMPIAESFSTSTTNILKSSSLVFFFYFYILFFFFWVGFCFKCVHDMLVG